MNQTPAYLNLDDLAEEPQRFLRSGGQDHPILEQTVDGFIAATKLIADLEALPETDHAGQVSIHVKLIKLRVPSIEESDLTSRPLSGLSKITAFIRGDDEVAPAAPEVEGESEKK